MSTAETDPLAERLHRAFHSAWSGPGEPLNLYVDSEVWQAQAAVVREAMAEALDAAAADVGRLAKGLRHGARHVREQVNRPGSHPQPTAAPSAAGGADGGAAVGEVRLEVADWVLREAAQRLVATPMASRPVYPPLTVLRLLDKLAAVEALAASWEQATCVTDGAPCSWHRVALDIADDLRAALTAAQPGDGGDAAAGES